MNKIKDFIEQCQLTNAMTEYPKNTLVWAKIPEKYRESKDVEVCQVQILDHDSESRKYTVSYKDQQFEIKYEDVVVSQGQLDQMPITDSEIIYKTEPGKIDDIVSIAIALNPNVTNSEIQNLVNRIGLLDEGELKITLESRENENKISIPTGNMFFVIEHETKPQ